MVSILILALPADSGWISLGLPTQALIVGLALHVAQDLLQKANFVLTSLVAFVWKRKHRTYPLLNILIVAGSVILFPLLAGIMLVSSVLSAPLLSLFTLPIFSVSFPRTRHFWPGFVDYSSVYLKSTDETVYYQQSEVEVVKAVHRSLSCGAIPAQPGTHVLVRFENRLSLVSILEVGRGFCTVSTRGLELQETSCHSEEATQIDDIFETQQNPKSCGQSWFNTNLLNTLLPLDSMVIKTYSDAHNVLTGIIDQPSALQRFSCNFMKALVWVFNQRMKSMATFTERHSNQDADHSGEEEQEDLGESIEPSQASPGVTRFSMVGWKQDRSKSLFTTFLGDDSPRSSLSSVVDFPVSRHPITPTESWFNSTHGGPGLIPQDIPLETLEKALETTILPKLPKAGKFQLTGSSKVSPAYSEGTFMWQPPPLTHLQIFRVMQHFPHDWHSFLNNKMVMDSEKFELLSRTVVGCFSLFDVPAQSTLSQNAAALTYPLDIYRRFCGNVPHSPHLKWMTEQPEVWKLALQSYRCVRGMKLTSLR